MVVQQTLSETQQNSPIAQQTRMDEWSSAIRMRELIGRELANWGIMTPEGVGAALGMHTVEAQGLLARRRWHENDLTQLRAAAERLGLIL